MIEKLTQDEIEFMENFYFSQAQAECLFSDFDNLTVMEEEKLAHVRFAQIPLLSHEYIVDDTPTLTTKENFQLRKGAGDCYALGGRNFGKTLISQKVDLLIRFLLCSSQRIGYSSYDAIHIRGVLEEVVPSLEHHPMLRLLDAQVNRSPTYRICTRNGNVLEGINMNITGKEPGKQFFQKHLHVLYIDECSMETEQVYKLRRDSVSELGCIFRLSGMTNFTKYTPCGQIFYDSPPKVFRQIVNLPQYCNPNWNEEEKQKALKDFGGESSFGFRIFIVGEVVEDGISAFDMSRIRCFYDEHRTIKSFEVDKKTFENFENIIFVERPKNAEECYIDADIGESAPTEIAVIFKIDKKYRYEYNITLYNLTDKEQFRVFKWLAELLQANYIGIDCTDGTGRAIFRSLEEVFPRENLVWVAFTEKIAVDFERHPETKEILFKDGEPIPKEEFVSEWSVKHLRDVLYSGIIDLPMDFKLDKQLNSVMAFKSKTINGRTIYKCASPDDHIFQAFQVFSISHWLCQFALIKPVKTKVHCKSGA